jgi:hypothetical protein
VVVSPLRDEWNQSALRRLRTSGGAPANPSRIALLRGGGGLPEKHGRRETMRGEGAVSGGWESGRRRSR